MSIIRALGYIGFETNNLDAWKKFATEVIGLQLGEELGDGTLVFRADEYQRRIFIHPGASEDIVYAGWEVRSRQDLRALSMDLREKGVEVIAGTPEEAAMRGVLEIIKFHDAHGVPQEAFFGAVIVNHDPFRSPVGQRPFLTGEQGIGHIVMNVGQAYQIETQFYENVLGFKLSDFNDLDIPGLPFPGHLTFFRCNSRHHSIALSNLQFGPKKFNHLMLELNSIEEVGLTYDRAKQHGAHILIDLGQHTNDKVFSFYIMTPSGWSIEVGWGALHIDEETWHVTHHPRPSSWGHLFSPPVAQHTGD